MWDSRVMWGHRDRPANKAPLDVMDCPVQEVRSVDPESAASPVRMVNPVDSETRA